MSQPPKLTDTIQRTRNLARAHETFLQDLAADDLHDRLTLVNKIFQSAIVVTAFRQVWADRMPKAQIIAQNEALDFDSQAHDLIIHSLGLHWADDPVGQMIQCRRALKPDGLFLAATLGGQTLQELRACLAQAETQVTGGLSPRVAPMAEIRDLGSLLQRAGFALPVADSQTHTASYRDIFHLMHDLRAMGEGNALASRLRVPTQRKVFEEAARLYVQHHSEAGRIKATFEIVTLTGWAPDASQQQPLRPGSATKRLADALGGTEQKLND